MFFLIPGLLLLFADTRFWTIAGLLCSQAGLTGYMCRKFAYPEMRDEHIGDLAPPPRFFPK